MDQIRPEAKSWQKTKKRKDKFLGQRRTVNYQLLTIVWHPISLKQCSKQYWDLGQTDDKKWKSFKIPSVIFFTKKPWRTTMNANTITNAKNGVKK